MRTVEITGPRECRVVERPNPAIRDNYVRIRIHTAPMCTEFQAYRDGQETDCLGHEAAGEVVEVAQPGRVSVGDRVVVMPQNGCGVCSLCLSGEHIYCASPRDPHAVCGTSTGRATYADICIQQDWLLVPVPEDISYDQAAMACCGLGPTFNAMQAMDVKAGDTVLVSGLGPVGLGAVVNARFRGARVLGLEPNRWRADLAMRMGVEAVVDPGDAEALASLMALTDGVGADKSVETSSVDSAPGFLVKATRRRGHVASVGWGGPVMARDVVAKGLTLHGAWHWNHLRDVDLMWHTIRGSGGLLEQQSTHAFPLDRVREAFELQLTGQCGKVLLHP